MGKIRVNAQRGHTWRGRPKNGATVPAVLRFHMGPRIKGVMMKGRTASGNPSPCCHTSPSRATATAAAPPEKAPVPRQKSR